MRIPVIATLRRRFRLNNLTYDSTIGEYARYIDVRSWAPTNFHRRMKLTNGQRYAYTYVTATIGWDPITTAITKVQSEATAPQIKGLTTVTEQ